MFLATVRRVTTIAPLAALLAWVALAAPAAASPVVVVDGSHAAVRNDPTLPPPAATALPVPPRRYVALAAHRGGPTVTQVLARARISGKRRAGYRAIYLGALRAVHRLRGYRRVELQSVIDSVRDLARRRQLSVTRMPNVFLELERNAQYWPVHGAPTVPQQGVGLGGARVEFIDDPVVVFQWYPGEGLRIQQLATFGRVNGLNTVCEKTPASCDRVALRRDLDRIVTLATNRNGFVAWEYLFAFGGGAPPWVSGMAQGAAIDALTRGAAVLGDSQYLGVAIRALGAYERRPFAGVRAPTRRGAHYLLYSFAPGYFVLNGFLEAEIGLFDLAKATGSAQAQRLFAAGDREARAEIPRFDTGSWSRYSLGGPLSDVGYHRLARDFLRGLCKRTGERAYCAAADRWTRYLRQRGLK